LHSAAGPTAFAVISGVVCAAGIWWMIRRLQRRPLRSPYLAPTRAGWALVIGVGIALNLKWLLPFVHPSELLKLAKFGSHPADPVIALLREHTAKNDVVLVAFPVDIIGIRRQFLDWRAEWYLLYSKQGLADLIHRAKALGLDIDRRDSVAFQTCGFWKRLLIERCVQEFPPTMQILYGSKPWVPLIDRLQAIQPSLAYVLERNANQQSGDYPYPIAAKTDDLVLFKVSKPPRLSKRQGPG
jgi:hypothetical protein